MLTKNYYSAFRNMLDAYTSLTESVRVPLTSYLGYALKSGDSYGSMDEWTGLQNSGKVLQSVITKSNTSSNPQLYGGVIFGDGTGAVSSDDYKLFGSVVTGFSYSATQEVVRTDNECVKKHIYTITNGTSEDVTISEIGYIAQYYSGGYYHHALLDHTLLEEPVTIPAGGVGQVTYTITFNIA